MLFNIIFKQYLNIFIRNFVLCIQIRFVSTEKTTRIASRASCLIHLVHRGKAVEIGQHTCSSPCTHPVDLFPPPFPVHFYVLSGPSQEIIFYQRIHQSEISVRIKFHRNSFQIKRVRNVIVYENYDFP